MKVIEYWRADIWDGADRHNPGPSFSSEALAAEWKRKNVHDYISRHVLVIFDSLEEQQQNTQLELRRRVYDKLSVPEREAIGMRERP